MYPTYFALNKYQILVSAVIIVINLHWMDLPVKNYSYFGSHIVHNIQNILFNHNQKKRFFTQSFRAALNAQL